MSDQEKTPQEGEDKEETEVEGHLLNRDDSPDYVNKPDVEGHLLNRDDSRDKPDVEGHLHDIVDYKD